MKVSELIVKLQSLPQDAIVIIERESEYRVLMPDDIEENESGGEPGAEINHDDTTEDEWDDLLRGGKMMQDDIVVIGGMVTITTWS